MVLRSLASIAVTAQHLQVVRLVGAASRYRVNVIYLKRGAILGGNAAHLAAVVVALQYFKAKAGFDRFALWLLFYFQSNFVPLNKGLTFMLVNCE